MEVIFEESNMTFSFEEKDVFRIEKSPRFNLITGANPCECIALFQDKVVLIEAKSSSPRPETNDMKLSALENYANRIAVKFSDSLTYYTATYLKHQLPDLLPPNIQAVPLAKQEYEFCLIIYGHRKSWLPPVLDQLKKSMKKTLKLWGLSDASVKVMNEQIALSRGLITK